MRGKIFFILLLSVTARTVFAQNKADTGAIIREFDKVMAFSVQPYLHYTSTTSFRSGIRDNAMDTGFSLHSNFYKLDDDLYVGNEQEEMYLQDSLLIRINHQRKTIQLNKVDVATKKKMDMLPMRKTEMQKMFRDRFTISAMPDEGDTGRILIRSNTTAVDLRAQSMEMLLFYSRELHLPLLMEITLTMPGQTTDHQAQTLSVHFANIGMTREKAVGMPLWKEKIAYDEISGTFSGKGPYEGYEVIKTF